MPGTAAKTLWGENSSAENSTRELIDETQPADQGAAGQAFLVSGIDLPDVVRLPRGMAFRVRFACEQQGRCGRGAVPALQSAGAGDGLFGVEPLQDDAQERSAPSGMLLVEEEDLIVQGMGQVSGMVRGPELERLGLLKACHESLDSAWLEMEGGGDVRRGLTETAAVPDLLADGLRERSRHDVTSKKE